jgi:2-oxoglutarate ferredoxin oxidoreductase subunit alpha
MSDRLVIKIAGESGMGIESSGMIVMKALKNMGFFVYGEREFPSLIKGGNANQKYDHYHIKSILGLLWIEKG